MDWAARKIGPKQELSADNSKTKTKTKPKPKPKATAGKKNAKQALREVTLYFAEVPPAPSLLVKQLLLRAKSRVTTGAYISTHSIAFFKNLPSL